MCMQCSEPTAFHWRVWLVLHFSVSIPACHSMFHRSHATPMCFSWAPALVMFRAPSNPLIALPGHPNTGQISLAFGVYLATLVESSTFTGMMTSFSTVGRKRESQLVLFVRLCCLHVHRSVESLGLSRWDLYASSTAAIALSSITNVSRVSVTTPAKFSLSDTVVSSGKGYAAGYYTKLLHAAVAIRYRIYCWRR